MASELIQWAYGRYSQNNYKTVAKRIAILAFIAAMARNNKTVTHATLYHMNDFEYKDAVITGTCINKAMNKFERFDGVRIEREETGHNPPIAYHLNYNRLVEMVEEVRGYISCLDEFIETRVATTERGDGGLGSTGL